MTPIGFSRFGPMSSPAPAIPPTNQAALLVIRAWREAPTEPSFRARITEVPNLDAPEELVQLASTRGELHAALDRWLDRLIEA